MSDAAPPSRRLFAKRALGEVVSLIDEIRGRPQRRLSDLAGLPPDKLALLKGVVRQDVQLTVSSEAVSVVSHAPDGSSASVAVLECTPENLAVFHRINGAQTLGEIADAIARDLAWERERAWRHVAGVFVRLVERGICLPTNVVD